MKIELDIPDRYEIEQVIPVFNLAKDATESLSVILRPKKRKVVKFIEDVNGPLGRDQWADVSIRQ